MARLKAERPSDDLVAAKRLVKAAFLAPAWLDSGTAYAATSGGTLYALRAAAT